MSELIDLAKQLIACKSITPNNAGCLDIIGNYLEPLGFKVEKLRFGKVDNLWARSGNKKPMLLFAGHADVVPPGSIANWDTDPFIPTEKDGFLYGRGASDMKGGLAAMLCAASSFLRDNTNHFGSIGFLVTCDEEGEAVDGTKKVLSYLKHSNIDVEYCIVGEPSSAEKLGDQIKIGRRGSLNCKLTVSGKQSHVAYACGNDNPIHKSFTVLDQLAQITWDQENNYFPPTALQITNISGGYGLYNVVPGSLEVLFNIRFSPEVTPDEIKSRVTKVFDNHDIEYKLDWKLSAEPYFSKPGKLAKIATDVIKRVAKQDAELTTSGGTSDGRFIVQSGAEVIELGSSFQTIHQTNERVKLDDLEVLQNVYVNIMERLLT